MRGTMAAELLRAAQAGSVEGFEQAAAGYDGDLSQVKDEANGAGLLHVAAHSGKTALAEHLVDACGLDVNATDGASAEEAHASACTRPVSSPPPLPPPFPPPPAACRLPPAAGTSCPPTLAPPADRRTLLPDHDAHPAGNGSTPLMLAIEGGHTGAAEALLERGADVDALRGSAEGAAPLHLAVAGGHQALAQRLAASGGGGGAPSSSGTPLMLAAARSNIQLIEALLAAGAAAAAAPDARGLTPLFLAVAVGSCPDCVRLLAKAGCDVNGRAYGSFTPLHVAAEMGKLELARALLEVGCWVRQGADAAARGLAGITLMPAVRECWYRCARARGALLEACSGSLNRSPVALPCCFSNRRRAPTPL